MRIARCRYQAITFVGAVEGDHVVDLGFHDDIEAVLEAKSRGSLAFSSTSSPIPLADVKLAAPVQRPPEFLGIGLNYKLHIAEAGFPTPEFPPFFNKQSSCVTGPYDPIVMPGVSTALDYEGELGIVIGKPCRHVSRQHAHQFIAGYLIVNDVSVRDWQMKSPTATLGKSFDTHGPIGPWIVTADELGDPHNLQLRTLVNGEQRQSTSTGDMLFDCFTQIEVLSTVFTLQPGTIIATGTPSGVGAAMKPPCYLKVGDTVRVEITGIGHIENKVVAE